MYGTQKMIRLESNTIWLRSVTIKLERVSCPKYVYQTGRPQYHAFKSVHPPPLAMAHWFAVSKAHHILQFYFSTSEPHESDFFTPNV